MQDCPNDPNADQMDTGDNRGNVCDLTPDGDDDGHTIDNAADNCPDVPNSDQGDIDNDGVDIVYSRFPRGMKFRLASICEPYLT